MKNNDTYNPIPKGLKKALETQNKLKESIQPIIDQQEKIKSITEGLKINLPELKTIPTPLPVEITNPAIKISQQLTTNSSVFDLSKKISVYQDNVGIINALETFQKISMGFLKSIATVADGLGNVMMKTIQSPFVQWLQNIDYNPIISLLQNLNFDYDISDRYRELNNAYLQAMYECKWFPYAGWVADLTLFAEVNEILSTSRGSSKRREKRIDKAILSYYTSKEIKNIKRSWKLSEELDPCIKKIMGQAIEAHLRGEYALSINCLATMWEGLLKTKMPKKKRKNDELKKDIKELIVDNGFEEIISDFYNNLIIGTCYSVDEVIEGVPNRNGVAHSWYKKYPNKKASLNAILLTDFIINLNPIDSSHNNND